MLVLSRRLGEEIVIDGKIRVKVVAVQGNRVKLGVVAPEEVTVHREEIARARAQFAADPSTEGSELVAH